MKLTTVLGSSNLNPDYYMFIPKQIIFWKHFNIKFIAILVGDHIPNELILYIDNIILWNNNLHLNTAFVAQNIRIYYPAIINTLLDDDIIMITDMDMLPMNNSYFTNDIHKFTKDDFIYYRYVDNNQIFMCYNAAHPNTWANVFQIFNQNDIVNRLNNTYNYNYIPRKIAWYIDQEIMYNHLIKYPHLKILNKNINRLEMFHFNNNTIVYKYDDAHFHRSYSNNINKILIAQKQLNIF